MFHGTTLICQNGISETLNAGQTFRFTGQLRKQLTDARITEGFHSPLSLAVAIAWLKFLHRLDIFLCYCTIFALFVNLSAAFRAEEWKIP